MSTRMDRLIDCCHRAASFSPVSGHRLSREDFLRIRDQARHEHGSDTEASAVAALETAGLPGIASALREIDPALLADAAQRAVVVACARELRARVEEERAYIEKCLGCAPGDAGFYSELSLLMEQLHGIPISHEELARHGWPGEVSRYLTGRILHRCLALASSAPALEGKRLLVIGAGDVDHRGYILESLSLAGCALVLVSDALPGWERKYIADHILAPLDDAAGVITQVQAYHRRDPFDGLLCYIEPYVELAAQVGEALGLRFLSPGEAGAVRDKSRMRDIIKERGLRSPQVLRIDSPALEIPPGFRFPAVLKPRKGHSSINVVRIDDEARLREVWSLLHQEQAGHGSEWHVEGDYMLEEYITGKEFSVESVVSQGQVFHLAITEKFKGPEPYFEEVGHCLPAKLPAALREAIHATVSTAIEALGIRHSGVHTEVMVGDGVTIVEVNARLGGGKLPFLAKLATGYDLSQAAGLAALGEPLPPYQAKRDKVIGICAFVPREPGVVQACPALPEVASRVVEFHFWTDVGTRVAPPPDQFFTRLGFVVVEGQSREEIADTVSRIVPSISSQIGVPLVVPDFQDQAGQDIIMRASGEAGRAGN